MSATTGMAEDKTLGARHRIRPAAMLNFMSANGDWDFAGDYRYGVWVSGVRKGSCDGNRCRVRGGLFRGVRFSRYNKVESVRNRAFYILLRSLGPLNELNVLISRAINRCKAQ